jgi:hypothetical protein
MVIDNNNHSSLLQYLTYIKFIMQDLDIIISYHLYVLVVDVVPTTIFWKKLLFFNKIIGSGSSEVTGQSTLYPRFVSSNPGPAGFG